jgi:alanyl-tRNA synthetase
MKPSPRTHTFSLVTNLATMLKVPAAELPDRVASLVERLRHAERELERRQVAQLAEQAMSLADGAKTINGTRVLTAMLPGQQAGDLRTLAQNMVAGVADAPAVVIFATTSSGKLAYASAVNHLGTRAGLSAVAVLKQFSDVLGGRGGGSQAVAQGGGGDPAKAAHGFVTVEKLLADIPAR